MAMGPPHFNTTTRDIERFVNPIKMLGSFVPIHYVPAPGIKLGQLQSQVFAVMSDPAHIDEMIRTADERLQREYCGTLNPSRSTYQDLLAAVFAPYVKGTPEAQATLVNRESVDALLRLCKDPVVGNPIPFPGS